MRILRRFTAILILSLMLIVSINAAEPQGSIRLQTEQVNTQVFMACVAQADGTVCEPFDRTGLSVEELNRTWQADEHAALLYECVAEYGCSAQSTATDFGGVALFPSVPRGCYLIWSDDGQFLPLLVFVPTKINGAEQFDITAKPKLEPAPPSPDNPPPPSVVTPTPSEEPVVPTPPPDEPVPPPEEPDDPQVPGGSGSIPQTGVNIWPKCILLAVGVIGSVAGAVLLSRNSGPGRNRGLAALGVGVVLVLFSAGLHTAQLRQDELAGDNAKLLLSKLETDSYRQGGAADVFLPETVPEQTIAPESDMPVQNQLGYDLIGVLSLPDVKIDLPVMSDWSYDLLDVAPCRYSGSFAEGELILMGHNYRSHFASLRKVEPGAQVHFKGVDGSEHAFTVARVDILHKDELDKLSSEYPLSIFTCTADRTHRIVLRCESVAEQT